MDCCTFHTVQKCQACTPSVFVTEFQIIVIFGLQKKVKDAIKLFYLTNNRKTYTYTSIFSLKSILRVTKLVTIKI